MTDDEFITNIFKDRTEELVGDRVIPYLITENCFPSEDRVLIMLEDYYYGTARNRMGIPESRGYYAWKSGQLLLEGKISKERAEEVRKRLTK